MKLVSVALADIPGYQRRWHLWYDDAPSAQAVIEGYERATLFRFAPNQHVRVHGALVVNLRGRGLLEGDTVPLLELDMRRAPWTSAGGVRMDAFEGAMVATRDLACTVETFGGIAVKRAATHFRLTRVAPVDVNKGGELAIRARLRVPLPPGTSMDAALVLVIEYPAS